MATVLEVPLLPATAQYFQMTMNGTQYGFRFLWNPAAACWMMDIYDSDWVSLAMGVPLVTGADLLGQLGYLGIGTDGASWTQLVVLTNAVGKSPDEVPSFTNLGIDGHLYEVIWP
jgi:hypothetical protein